MVFRHPQLLRFSFVIRYVSLTSFINYGFTFLHLLFPHHHKTHMFIFWSVFVANPSHNIMALVVRIEPNALKTLLTHDDVTNRLSQVIWLGFVQSFKGFNIEVAREFAKNFDGTKVRVWDVYLQVDQECIARATCLLQVGDKWFKNMKVNHIPWNSLLASKPS